MDKLRIPGFVWVAILVGTTAFLQALATGLEGLADTWWAPAAVALIAGLLKAMSEFVGEVDGSPAASMARAMGREKGVRSARAVEPRMVEVEYEDGGRVDIEVEAAEPFWVRFLLG